MFTRHEGRPVDGAALASRFGFRLRRGIFYRGSSRKPERTVGRTTGNRNGDAGLMTDVSASTSFVPWVLVRSGWRLSTPLRACDETVVYPEAAG